MSSVWGERIKLSVFGESHGKGVGVVIDGLPPGITIDWEQVQEEMNRRAPGRGLFTTPRQEEDRAEVWSGVFQGKTTGTPLSAFIANKDQRSKDYGPLQHCPRPGHGDYTGYVKYQGYNDYRGGGHFSGRLTAPLTFAGAIAKQILAQRDIIIGSHITQIGDVYDQRFSSTNIAPSLLERLRKTDFPVLDPAQGERMKSLILGVKAEGDSVGGMVEGVVINLPVGVGSPIFSSIESNLARLFFSIPAVKGVDFGSGFDFAGMKGSEANDPFYVDQGKVKTSTNHCGGVLGGISNGMPLFFRVAFKPTPSIGRRQETVDLSTMEARDITVEGRHDPCIVLRALPVVEAMTAIGILDLLELG